MNKTVFLDRDGTINIDTGYLDDPGQLELIPRSAGAISRLNAAGFKVVVITNQAGVARGIIRVEQLPKIQKVFCEMLEKEGAKIDGYYYCPHHPEGSVAEYSRSCGCRKPEPGLLLKAAEEMAIELSHAYVVGDKISDVQLAHNVGAVGIMVLTGHGGREHERYTSDIRQPDYTANDLHDAVEWIVNRELSYR